MSSINKWRKRWRAKNSIFTHRWASIEIRKLHAGWHRPTCKSWLNFSETLCNLTSDARVLGYKKRGSRSNQQKCNDPRRSDHYGSSLSCFIKSSFAFPADGFPKTTKILFGRLIEKAFSINGIFYAYHCERGSQLTIGKRKVNANMCARVRTRKLNRCCCWAVKLLCLFTFMLRLNALRIVIMAILNLLKSLHAPISQSELLRSTTTKKASSDGKSIRTDELCIIAKVFLVYSSLSASNLCLFMRANLPSRLCKSQVLEHFFPLKKNPKKRNHRRPISTKTGLDFFHAIYVIFVAFSLTEFLMMNLKNENVKGESIWSRSCCTINGDASGWTFIYLVPNRGNCWLWMMPIVW